MAVMRLADAPPGEMPEVVKRLYNAAVAGDKNMLSREIFTIVGKFRERCLESPEVFLRGCLGYAVTPFHLRWFEHQRSNRRTILLAPRGHGKSTVCTVGYSLWSIVHNPNVRILIASKSAAQAELLLGEIRQHMENNRLFRAVFGDLVNPRAWNVSRVFVANRTAIQKEPTITAIGQGTSLPTWHFDVIIADDLHDLWNSQTAAQRETVWRWFEQVVLPTLEPGGELHVIGTRWHDDDLYGRLLAASERAAGEGHAAGVYATLIERAIIHEDPDPARCVVLWPERFPYSTLRALRDEQGPVIFALQYQCSTALGATEGGVFGRTNFRIISTDEARRLAANAQFVAQAWDVAVGKEAVGGDAAGSHGGHYTACVTVALTHDGRFVVLDWWRGRPSLTGQMREIERLAALWEPHVIGIEAVAYQAVLAQHMARTTTLPIVPVVPDRDKIRRAWTVQPYVEAGRVAVSSAVSGLVDVLVAFPFGDEDDSVDAFVYAIQLAARRERAKLPPTRRGL